MNAIRTFQNHTPEIHETCMIDGTCVIIGEVSLADNVSVWPYAVLRGDVNSITVGARSNIQDGSVLHVSHKTAAKPEGSPLVIGEDVTVGHKACCTDAVSATEFWLVWGRRFWTMPLLKMT